MNDEPKFILRYTALGSLAVGLLVIGAFAAIPQYRVYSSRLEGEAKLRESESSRMVQIEDAKGKHEAAKMLALAEVERARGVAEANKIIGDSLKDHPEYLTYLWIKEVNADGNAVIYVPTEAGLPILEAGRLPRPRVEHKPAEKHEDPAPKK